MPKFLVRSPDVRRASAQKCGGRIVALILVPCLLADPSATLQALARPDVCRAALPDVLNNPLTPMWERVQFFSDQALALPATADLHGYPLVEVARQTETLEVLEAPSDTRVEQGIVSLPNKDVPVHIEWNSNSVQCSRLEVGQISIINERANPSQNRNHNHSTIIANSDQLIYSDYLIPPLALLPDEGLQGQIWEDLGTGRGILLKIGLAKQMARMIGIEQYEDELEQAKLSLEKAGFHGVLLGPNEWRSYQARPEDQFILIHDDFLSWFSAPAKIRNRVAGGVITGRIANLGAFNQKTHNAVLQDTAARRDLQTAIVGGYLEPVGQNNTQHPEWSIQPAISQFDHSAWTITVAKYNHRSAFLIQRRQSERLDLPPPAAPAARDISELLRIYSQAGDLRMLRTTLTNPTPMEELLLFAAETLLSYRPQYWISGNDPTAISRTDKALAVIVEAIQWAMLSDPLRWMNIHAVRLCELILHHPAAHLESWSYAAISLYALAKSADSAVAFAAHRALVHISSQDAAYGITQNALTLLENQRPLDSLAAQRPVTHVLFIDDALSQMGEVNRVLAQAAKISAGIRPKVVEGQVAIELNKIISTDGLSDNSGLRIVLIGGKLFHCIQDQVKSLFYAFSQRRPGTINQLDLPLTAIMATGNRYEEPLKFFMAEYLAAFSDDKKLSGFRSAFWQFVPWFVRIDPSLWVKIMKDGILLRELNSSGDREVILNIITTPATLFSIPTEGHVPAGAGGPEIVSTIMRAPVDGAGGFSLPDIADKVRRGPMEPTRSRWTAFVDNKDPYKTLPPAAAVTGLDAVFLAQILISSIREFFEFVRQELAALSSSDAFEAAYDRIMDRWLEVYRNGNPRLTRKNFQTEFWNVQPASIQRMNFFLIFVQFDLLLNPAASCGAVIKKLQDQITVAERLLTVPRIREVIEHPERSLALRLLVRLLGGTARRDAPAQAVKEAADPGRAA